MFQTSNTYSGSVSNHSQMAQKASPIDELARIFNTALVASHVEHQRDFSVEIMEAMKSPAFKVILSSIRQHALLEGITEKQAAEQVIGAFRQIDRIWTDYVFQEGLDRVRGRAT